MTRFPSPHVLQSGSCKCKLPPYHKMFLGFLDSSAGKESTCNAGDTGAKGSIPGLGRSPGGGHGNLLQYSCLKNPHGQRSLAGYSPWGHKEFTRLRDPTQHSTISNLPLLGVLTCIGSRNLDMDFLRRTVILLTNHNPLLNYIWTIKGKWNVKSSGP